MGRSTKADYKLAVSLVISRTLTLLGKKVTSVQGERHFMQVAVAQLCFFCISICIYFD